MSNLRWTAVITYRSEHGPIDVEHSFEEFDDLGDIVERGPDWNAITDIRITLARNLLPGLTIEHKLDYS